MKLTLDNKDYYINLFPFVSTSGGSTFQVDKVYNPE